MTSYGTVFDRVAAEYDRHRPTYPEPLVDHACAVAGLGSGDPVLEVGSGTGQLTRLLLARRLRVTALEPGDRLIALARENLHGAGAVTFVNARLEDAQLPRGHYRAVFAASSFHWADPDVSWQRVAEALVPSGMLALVQYYGLEDPGSDDQRALLAILAGVAPELAADWPSYRDLHGTIAGAQARRANVSDVWAWLGSCDVARAYAARLFDDVQIVAAPALIEQTADELNALLGTMSFWSRLSPDQRAALEQENDAFARRLGRPIRSSIVACLVTARHRVPAV